MLYVYCVWISRFLFHFFLFSLCDFLGFVIDYYRLLIIIFLLIFCYTFLDGLVFGIHMVSMLGLVTCVCDGITFCVVFLGVFSVFSFARFSALFSMWRMSKSLLYLTLSKSTCLLVMFNHLIYSFVFFHSFIFIMRLNFVQFFFLQFAYLFLRWFCGVY